MNNIIAVPPYYMKGEKWNTNEMILIVISSVRNYQKLRALMKLESRIHSLTDFAVYSTANSRSLLCKSCIEPKQRNHILLEYALC